MGQISEEINYKQKEIVLLPYPFTDQEGNKVRPAVIMSNDLFNKESHDLILIPITSVIKNESNSILIDNSNLALGELPKQSRIKYDKLFTIDKSLVIMKIGRLKDEKFSEIKSRILKLF